MAVYVTGMLMPLSMFDVCEWQMLQKLLLSLSLSFYFILFLFLFFLLFGFWIMFYKWWPSQCAVGNEDVIVH
jgi:hypothetical protein